MIIPDSFNLWPGLWNLDTMAIAGLTDAGYERWRKSAEEVAVAAGRPWPPEPGNCDTGHQIGKHTWVVYCPSIRYWLDRVGQYERYELTARTFTLWIRPVHRHEVADGPFLEWVAKLLPPSEWERDRFIDDMDEDVARKMLATLLESGVEIRYGDRAAVKVADGFEIRGRNGDPSGWWNSPHCIRSMTSWATLDELRALLKMHWTARGEVTI